MGLHYSVVPENLRVQTLVVQTLCEREPQSFSHCGFFYHTDLQSLSDYMFFLLCVATTILIGNKNKTRCIIVC